MVGSLISTEDDTDFVNIHSGLSTTIVGSFATVTTDPSFGIVLDANNNLITTDDVANFIYLHDGISSTLTGSLAAPSSDIRGVAIIGGSLLSSDGNTDHIYQHSGISTVLNGSFVSPSIEPAGMVVKNGSLYSANTSVTRHIYFHSGISSVLNGSMTTANPTNTITDITFDNGNLLSTYSATAAHIYQHSGISTTLLGSFLGPQESMRGLTFVLVGITVTDLTPSESITLTDTAFVRRLLAIRNILDSITLTEVFNIYKLTDKLLIEVDIT